MSDFENTLDQLEKESLLQDIEIISRDKGIFLGELVEKRQPKNILEIGTGIGYSTLFLVSALPKEGKIYTCEKELSRIQIAKGAFKKLGLTNKIDLVGGNVFNTLPKLKMKWDIVFIDGNRDEYYEYLQLFGDELNLGAVVVANSVGTYENLARDYIREVRKSGNYESRYQDFGIDGMEVSIKE